MMYVSSCISVCMVLAVLANGAAIAPEHTKAMTRGSHQAPRAIYFISNEATNNIVALPIQRDGTLAMGTMTATGGAGGNELNAMGKPDAPDALASQGAVRVAGDLLFAVNAGSNTLSMFEIDPADPTKLCLLGKPVDTIGQFPVSVAVSLKHQVACVASTGAKAGIACAKFSRRGLSTMDTLRPFNLNQTTPPQGPVNGPADTFFNEDETALFTMVKGNPAVNNTGFISAFPITQGAISTQETRSSPAGTAVLFGTVNIPGTNDIFATDASFGAAIISVDAQLRGTTKATTKLAGQKATCWATVSRITGSGFVTDVLVNHLVEINLSTGAVIKDQFLTNGNPGMIDLEAAGAFIYALSPGNGTVKSAIAVFDISGGQGSAKQIQNFNPTGVNSNAQGMAVLR